jgi:hypothetical protein
MSWQRWLYDVADFLGIDTATTMPVREALERTSVQERAVFDLRSSLIHEAQHRLIDPSEVALFDMARKNVIAAAFLLRRELIDLGIPAGSMPDYRSLPGLPRRLAALRQPQAPALPSSSTNFGLARVGSRPSRRPEYAATLGDIGVMDLWAGVLLRWMETVQDLAWALAVTIGGEPVVELLITEAQVPVAEGIHDQITQATQARQEAIAGGATPEEAAQAFPLPDPVRPEDLGGTNPLVAGLPSIIRWGIGGTIAAGVLWVGWRVYSDIRGGGAKR